jgi:hypothetical protein
VHTGAASASRGASDWRLECSKRKETNRAKSGPVGCWRNRQDPKRPKAGAFLNIKREPQTMKNTATLDAAPKKDGKCTGVNAQTSECNSDF